MKVQTFLFCDDVRQEINGKFILIGVYESGILFPEKTKFPVRLPSLGFFCRFMLEPGDKQFDEVEFKFSLDGKPILSVKGAIAVKDFSVPISVYRTNPGVVFPNEGQLEFEINLKLKSELVGNLKPGSISIKKIDPKTLLGSGERNG